jgi:hypothetical protein
MNDLISAGSSCVVFSEHQEYTPSTSHRSSSLTAEVMNVDNLKSGILLCNWLDQLLNNYFAFHTGWYQFKQTNKFTD